MAARLLGERAAGPWLERRVQQQADNPETERPAGLRRRLAAMIYDGLVLCGLLFAVTLAVLVLRGGRAVAPDTPWFTALLIVVMQLFFGWFWTHGGQTLGMRAWRLRIRSATGGPPGWRQAVIRFLAAWLSAVPLGLGFWWSLLDVERRTWHDRLSGTVLVHEPRRRAASPI